MNELNYTIVGKQYYSMSTIFYSCIIYNYVIIIWNSWFKDNVFGKKLMNPINSESYSINVCKLQSYTKLYKIK